ncbi:helicase-related protein [Acidomonas methanolica]|uniref:helicase-related protein n=1 Tax=Acidomonas methanolica TaxID=437 RepID=UPI00211A2AC0|nr:helicase-related protein [Acidomonas methanolica]
MTGKQSGSFSFTGHHAMPARVRAILGPTNTGKTHYALDRMLAHASGIIAFPLRLLARENYERMAALKGARAVALITGEEKIIPPDARWIACTTEAMPLDRHAEFIAIDEIQLCADPDRGHVFTDRLLNARGAVETLFLGAETIRPLLQRLVPGIEIDTRPRLSALIGTGHTKLSRLPPRSAIVAFSAADVYAIAEAIRQRRGGCAIVMGRLSPRTRNAQVQLYQNKEVDYLVATDAIGMGLNMDVTHVALAALTKFDGSALRPLQPQEIAQIAGRAGRGTRDGTFGTTGEARPMSESTTEAIETHRFDPLQRLYWRNSDLDFSNPVALAASLHRPPTRPGLTAGREAADLLTLEALAEDTAIRDAVTGSKRTKLLWEVCQIPDFRKLGDDSHTHLCRKLFFHLLEDGRIPAAWLANHIDSFSRTDGDIDTLMQRLAGVRVAAYVAARADWTEEAGRWQEHARIAEDQLSDALHERLTARFVDRRATSILRRLDPQSDRPLLSAVTHDGEVIVEGHAVGRMDGFTLTSSLGASGPEQRLMLRAGRRALIQEIPRRVRALVESPDEAFSLDRLTATVSWQDTPVARLRAGATLLEPDLRLLSGEIEDARQRDRVRDRLHAFLRTCIARDLAPLFAARDTVTLPEARGVLHRLVEAGGLAMLIPADHGLDRAALAQLRRLGVVIGSHRAFIPALLHPAPMTMRALLLALRHGCAPPPLPDAHRVSFPLAKLAPAALPSRAVLQLWAELGWIRAGDYLLRLDIAERLTREIRHLTRGGNRQADPHLLSLAGIPAHDLTAALRDLGLRVHAPHALTAATFGPASPLMLLAQRAATPRPPRPREARDDAHSPFAVLRTLQVKA